MSNVEVFEVGKRQLKDFVASGTLTVPVYADVPICRDSYAIVFKTSWFGAIADDITVWPGYYSREDVMGRLPREVDLNDDDCAYGFARHIEVWHVVDDDDLWLAWESEVAYSRLGGLPCHYRVMDGSECVLVAGELPSQVFVVCKMGGGLDCECEYYLSASDFGEAMDGFLRDGGVMHHAELSCSGEVACTLSLQSMATYEVVDCPLDVLTVWVWISESE